jgi:allene oxide cyclase
MQRRSIAGAALAVAVAALVLATTGVASGSGGHNDRHRLVFYERQTSFTFVDPAQDGPTPGDQAVGTSDLFRDAHFKHKAGSVSIACTVVTAQELECGATGHLRGGDVQVNGVVPLETKPASLAITGGTGKFRGANGQITTTPLNADGSDSRDVLIFTR